MDMGYSLIKNMSPFGYNVLYIIGVYFVEWGGSEY